VTKVVQIIENLDNLIKFLSTKNTIIMYCTIMIIIKTKELLKHVTLEKLINVIINQHFQTLYLKNSNNDVCLADAFLGCGDWVNCQFG
jgi:hypothetical protein